ncbi:MAG: hypothetical protein IPK18_01045 [Sphingobacteriales bacterium]|nr:MAG: hypothetical protein IPK18_01045 [Sphingobacteriales bacterium]
MKKVFLVSSILMIILFFAQCKKLPKPVNETELITRIDFTFTDSTNQSKIFLYCVDDAIYNNRKDTITLYPNRTYKLEIEIFSSKNTNTIDTISYEIEEEATEHQLFIISKLINNFNYLDNDSDGNPLGLISKITTDSTKTNTLSNLTLILRHELNKNGIGVKDGNPTNAGGGTDIDISLKIKLQEQ